MLLIFFLYYSWSSLAQDSRLFSGSYNQETLTKIIRDIDEQATDLTFYFDQSDTDTLLVTASYENQTLTDIFNKWSNDFNLFFLQNEDAVFITRTEIISDLPILASETNVVSQSSDTKGLIFRQEYLNSDGQEDELRVIQIGSRDVSNLGGSATISGTVLNTETLEPLVGVVVFKNNEKFEM